MPRLSPVDQAFFLLETPERPMNVGALLVLPPPARARTRFADRLVARMLDCPVGPPFNYRLKPGPFKPLLALDEDGQVDARKQVHRHALPRGSDLQALFKRICEIHVKLLPRDEPLWQMHVFTGLPDGRVALYFKTHHGLIDGIGFIRIVTHLMSTSAGRGKARAIWEGMLAVPPAAGAGKHRATGTAELVQFAEEARQTANDMARLMWHQGLRGTGLGIGLAAPFVTTPNVLKAAPSANRVLAHVKVPLQRARDIARLSGAKINDVMLAALDVAMNRYLEERGTPPDSALVADIPVALQDHGGAGNRITILQVPLGRPESTPVERLQQIMAETQEMKHEVRALSGGALMLYSIVQHSLASTIESLRLGELPMLANLVVSNPAGLEKRVYFNGVPVELALPISVVAHHQVLNVTVTTYVEDLHVTFIALREAIPDLERLAGYTAEAVDQLAADVAFVTRSREAARARPAPGRKAARRRARAGRQTTAPPAARPRKRG
jgi:WS/DGAT/MGAT family acyltransferase